MKSGRFLYIWVSAYIRRYPCICLFLKCPPSPTQYLFCSAMLSSGILCPNLAGSSSGSRLSCLFSARFSWPKIESKTFFPLYFVNRSCSISSCSTYLGSCRFSINLKGFGSMIFCFTYLLFSKANFFRNGCISSLTRSGSSSPSKMSSNLLYCSFVLAYFGSFSFVYFVSARESGKSLGSSTDSSSALGLVSPLYSCERVNTENSEPTRLWMIFFLGCRGPKLCFRSSSLFCILSIYFSTDSSSYHGDCFLIGSSYSNLIGETCPVFGSRDIGEKNSPLLWSMEVRIL